MRQVFSSQRLENVEGVARLLRDAGIEVRVTHGRSYKGNRRGTFSYREQEGPQPAVWVVRSEDQPRARAMLREAGLIDTTREGTGPLFRFDPQTQAGAAAGGRTPAQQRMLRIKIGLIGGILVLVILSMLRTCNRPPVEAELAAPPFDGRVAATLRPIARAVLAAEMGPINTPYLCVAVDGRDADPATLAGLDTDRHRLVPASHCQRVTDEDRGSFHRASGREASLVEIGAFRPAAADRGRIEFSAYHHRMYARYKTLEVARANGQWQVVRTIRHVSM